MKIRILNRNKKNAKAFTRLQYSFFLTHPSNESAKKPKDKSGHFLLTVTINPMCELCNFSQKFRNFNGDEQV
jgi:hypothetical protein